MHCPGTRVRARLSRRPQTRMPAPGQLLSIPRTSTPGHQLRETQSRPAHDPGWLSARLHSATPSGSAPQTPGRFGSAWPATGQPRNNAASAGLPAARRRPRRTLAVCRGYPCPCRPPSVIQRRKSRLNGRGRYRRTLHRKHPPPFCAVAHRRQPVPPRPLQSRQLLDINSGTSTPGQTNTERRTSFAVRIPAAIHRDTGPQTSSALKTPPESAWRLPPTAPEEVATRFLRGSGRRQYGPPGPPPNHTELDRTHRPKSAAAKSAAHGTAHSGPFGGFAAAQQRGEYPAKIKGILRLSFCCPESRPVGRRRAAKAVTPPASRPTPPPVTVSQLLFPAFSPAPHSMPLT